MFDLTKKENDTFGDLERLSREFFAPSLFFSPRAVMKTDIEDNEDNYTIKIEMPGFKKENISVSVEDNMLVVSGERKNEISETGSKCVHSERGFGSYSRSYSLDGVEADKITAVYADGVLTLVLPKKPRPEKKTINIE